MRIFFDDKNNVAELVVGNALCEEIIAVDCHSLCCFLPNYELVETRFFLFLNTLYHGILQVSIIIKRPKSYNTES